MENFSTLLIAIILLVQSCSSDATKRASNMEHQRMISILADVQLLESKASSYNLWQKDSLSSLLYFQLCRKYEMSQDSINQIIQQSLSDPIRSQQIYELVAQKLDSISSTIK